MSKPKEKAVARTHRFLVFHKWSMNDRQYRIAARNGEQMGDVRFMPRFGKGKGAWTFVPSTRRAYDAASLAELTHIVDAIAKQHAVTPEPTA